MIFYITVFDRRRQYYKKGGRYTIDLIRQRRVLPNNPTKQPNPPKTQETKEEFVFDQGTGSQRDYLWY
jgi:hypothetical protein